MSCAGDIPNDRGLSTSLFRNTHDTLVVLADLVSLILLFYRSKRLTSTQHTWQQSRNPKCRDIYPTECPIASSYYQQLLKRCILISLPSQLLLIWRNEKRTHNHKWLTRWYHYVRWMYRVALRLTWTRRWILDLFQLWIIDLHLRCIRFEWGNGRVLDFVSRDLSAIVGIDVAYPVEW